MSNQQATAERNYNTSQDVETLKKQMAALMELLSLSEALEKLRRRVDDLENAEDQRQLQILRS